MPDFFKYLVYLTTCASSPSCFNNQSTTDG